MMPLITIIIITDTCTPVCQGVCMASHLTLASPERGTIMYFIVGEMEVQTNK